MHEKVASNNIDPTLEKVGFPDPVLPQSMVSLAVTWETASDCRFV